MAKMTVVVKSVPSRDFRPFVLSNEEFGCENVLTVRIPVPPGESRYVSEVYSGTGAAGSDQTYTVTADHDAAVTLKGCISEVDSENTEFSTACIKVALSATDPFFYTECITRQATNEFI